MVSLVLTACLASAAWYGYHTLSERVSSLEHTVSISTSALQAQLVQSSTTLSSALAQQQQFSSTLQNQLGSVQQQYGTISGAVNSLQKLSALDSELLKKYSKVLFLNENYLPASLTSIPVDFTVTSTRPYSMQSQALPYLVALLSAAKQSGDPMFVESAYRSFGEQAALKGDYTVIYGAGTANQFSADQGYSEHQLGTAIDFATDQTKGVLTGFDKTSAYTWMGDNAYQFGFILSYPKNNPYYTFEPWHWRFVGISLATYLHNNKIAFYDMDQRQIDTYLPSIFD